MHIFKRVEIWILLLLVAGVVIFVFSTTRDDEEFARQPSSTAEKSERAEPAFSVGKIEVKRDYGNAILEIHVTCKNPTGEELQLVSPAARLFAGSGPEKEEDATEVESFFLAFSPPPAIPPGEVSAAVLKFWAEKSHLEQSLWLRILDDAQVIKSAGPFDLESIPNQQSLVVRGTEWGAP